VTRTVRVRLGTVLRWTLLPGIPVSRLAEELLVLTLGLAVLAVEQAQETAGDVREALEGVSAFLRGP